MKNVGILTFHNGENYGAALQSYALKNTLKKMGVQAEVINYKKEKQYNNKCSLSIGKYLSKAYLARKIYALPYGKSLKQKQKAFSKFMEKNLDIDIKEIIDDKNISNFSNKFDMIMFGSDQIWNMSPKIYDRSKIFFGDFDYKGLKASYAASFGDTLNYAVDNKEYIKKMLTDFDYISVREYGGKKFLNDIGMEADLALDPTLLLDEKEWNEMIDSKPVEGGEYILYYSVNCRKDSWMVAKKLSKLTGLRVINLVEHPKILGAGFENNYTAGPLEFLNIIKSSKYVVTNSFHGMVFSIIFQKNFIPVFEENNGDVVIDERKYTVLKALGLEKYIHTNSMDIDLNKLNDIDYREAKEKLEELVKSSKAYIKTCIK